jgi:undecaprenyl-diphosphatase
MQLIVRFTAEYLFIVIILLEGAYLLAFHRARWLELFVAAAFIGGVAYLISLAANHLIQDPRPFMAGGFVPMIPGSADNGFPSDHTLLLGATAAVTLLASRRAGLFGLLGAILVGLARVYAGVHHLADIAGSLAIVGLAFLIYTGARRLLHSDQRH